MLGGSYKPISRGTKSAGIRLSHTVRSRTFGPMEQRLGKLGGSKVAAVLHDGHMSTPTPLFHYHLLSFCPVRVTSSPTPSPSSPRFLGLRDFRMQDQQSYGHLSQLLNPWHFPVWSSGQ